MIKKLISLALWSLVLLLLLVGMDQAFLHINFDQKALRTAQTFYLDLRGRVIALPDQPRPAELPSLDTVIAKSKKLIKQGKLAAKYLYTDGDGQIQFAKYLSEIPEEWRDTAQKLLEEGQQASAKKQTTH